MAFLDVTRTQDLQAQLNRSRQDLETAYEELRERSEDLNQSKSFLESILAGIRSGVIVLDRELRVIAWNTRAEDLWGLRGEEVRGQNFLNLDIGLPTDQLRAGIRSCLSGDGRHIDDVLKATNRRGKTMNARSWARHCSVPQKRYEASSF